MSNEGCLLKWWNQTGYILVSSYARIWGLALTLSNRQDLNSSILAGSKRIVDHTTFAELQWTRDPFIPNFFRLPPGFQTLSHLLSKGFIAILEDIYALQCIRDVPRHVKGDPMIMAYINNHTASTQCRLVELPNLSPVLECCRLAAYLCSVMLCCKVWCASVIPVSGSQALHSFDFASYTTTKQALVYMELMR